MAYVIESLMKYLTQNSIKNQENSTYDKLTGMNTINLTKLIILMLNCVAVAI